MFTFSSQVGETMYFLFCPACRWVVEMLSQQRIMLQDRKIAPTLFRLRSMTMTSTRYIKKTKTKTQTPNKNLRNVIIYYHLNFPIFATIQYELHYEFM